MADERSLALPRIEPNSDTYHASKETEGSISKDRAVANGKIASNTSFFRRLYKSFIEEDLKTMLRELATDKIIPETKAWILDGMGRLLGVDASRTRTGKEYKKDYGKYYSGYKYGTRDRGRNDDDDRDSRFDYRDIIFDSKGEAERVLDNLYELIEEYGKARVSDFLDFAGMSRHIRHTDNNYGWIDLRGARTRRVYDGYEIILPRERPLD